MKRANSKEPQVASNDFSKKLYWTQSEKELYDKWKGASKEELLKNVFELAEENTCEQEVISITASPWGLRTWCFEC